MMMYFFPNPVRLGASGEAEKQKPLWGSTVAGDRASCIQTITLAEYRSRHKAFECPFRGWVFLAD
jgi:hypothetical protein